MGRSSRSRLPARKGQSLVEFALFLPVLLGLLLGIIDTTMLLAANNTVSYAGRQGTRLMEAYGAVSTYSDCDILQAIADSLRANGTSLSGLQNVTFYRANSGDAVTSGDSDVHRVYTYLGSGGMCPSGAWALSSNTWSARSSGDHVGVTLRYRYKGFTPLYGGGVTLGNMTQAQIDPSGGSFVLPTPAPAPTLPPPAPAPTYTPAPTLTPPPTYTPAPTLTSPPTNTPTTGPTATSTATPTPQTIFTSQTPTSSGAISNYEGGVQFKASVAGKILAVRYWRPAGETGSHIGNIWHITGGPPVISVTFPTGSTSGWQTATLSSPLTISANTTYVVSVNVNNQYAVDSNGLSSSVTNGNLTALTQGAVYANPSGTFPTNTSGQTNSNFFRDVVFAPGP